MKVVNENLKMQTNYYGIKANNGICDVWLWCVKGNDMFCCAIPKAVETAKIFNSTSKAKEYCNNLNEKSEVFEKERKKAIERILKTKRIVEYKFLLEIAGDNEMLSPQ